MRRELGKSGYSIEPTKGLYITTFIGGFFCPVALPVSVFYFCYIFGLLGLLGFGSFVLLALFVGDFSIWAGVSSSFCGLVCRPSYFLVYEFIFLTFFCS